MDHGNDSHQEAGGVLASSTGLLMSKRSTSPRRNSVGSGSPREEESDAVGGTGPDVDVDEGQHEKRRMLDISGRLRRRPA